MKNNLFATLDLSGFVEMAKIVSRLAVSPINAYNKRYSELLFAGLTFPILSYILFSLNLGLERAAFLSTMTGIKVFLLAFFGLLIGAGTIFMITLLFVFSGKITKKNLDGVRFLGCVEYSFALTVLIETIGLVIHLISGENTSVIFGITGIFVALALIFRCFNELAGLDGLFAALFSFACGFITVLLLSVLFYASF